MAEINEKPLLTMKKKPVCSEFEQHAIRPICSTCGKKKEEHHISKDDVKEVQKILKETLNYDPPDHDIYDWVPPGCPEERIGDFFLNFPSDKVPKLDSEGEDYRIQQFCKQWPLHDISSSHARFVQEEGKQEQTYYICNVMLKATRMGSVKLWENGMSKQCPACLTLMEEKELVIIPSERNDVVYHPTCFVCEKCKEFLVDLLYCVHTDGKIYCERHYSEIHKTRCGTCDELIFSNSYVELEKSHFHVEHMHCSKCDRKIQDENTYEKENNIYCTDCYENLFCPVCFKCNQTISVGKAILQIDDKKWHVDCLICNGCSIQLCDELVKTHEDNYYCCNCYKERFAPRCFTCSTVFESGVKNIVKFEGILYHASCFKCVECKTTIGETGFVPTEDRIYCKTCYTEKFGVQCAQCRTAIHSGGVTYKKKAYHSDCFKCQLCSEVLGSSSFANYNNQIICITCFGEEYCKKCEVCQEIVNPGKDGDTYAHEHYAWHGACLKCSECSISLTKDPFATLKKKIFCKDCLDKANIAYVKS